MPATSRSLAAAFTPNRRVSPATMGILVAFEAAAALTVWWMSPLRLLPRPDEVARAFRVLWLQEGLGRELWASFAANLQALGIAMAISLALSYLTVLPIFRPIVAAVSKGRFLAFIGFPLLFTLVFANPHWIKVALLTLAMTVFFVTSMASVILEIPRERLEHARTLRMGEWRVVGEVVVLGTADRALEDHDPVGAPIPGARIQGTYDLMACGLAWHKGIAGSPRLLEMAAEIRSRFARL